MANPFRLLLLSVLYLIGATALAAAAPAMPASPLAQIPEEAFLTVQVQGVERTLDRFEALLRGVSPELLKRWQPELKELRQGMIDGRQWHGAVKEGPHFLVLLDVPDFGSATEPRAALIVRTERYQTFRDAYMTKAEAKSLRAEDGYDVAAPERDPLYFVNRKEFTVVTPSKEVAKRFAGKFKGLDGRMSADFAKRLLASDLGMYLSIGPNRAGYADLLKDSKRLFGEELSALDNVLKNPPSATLDLARQMVEPMFQALEDAEELLLTVDFQPSGLAVRLDSNLRKGSKTGKKVKDLPTATLAELDMMPDGLTCYSAWATNEPLLKEIGPWLLGVSVKKDRAHAEALTKLAKAAPGVYVTGADPFGPRLNIWSAADPAAVVNAHVALLPLLTKEDGYRDVPLRKRPVLTLDAQKLGELSLQRIDVGWDLPRVVRLWHEPVEGMIGLEKDGPEVLQRSLTKQVGQDVALWVGSDAKRVVLVEERDWTGAEKLLGGYLKESAPLGKQAAYRALRQELAAKATALWVLEPARYSDRLFEILKPLLKDAARRPKARDDKSKPGYVGVSLVLQGERIAVDVVVPAEAASEWLRRYGRVVYSAD